MNSLSYLVTTDSGTWRFTEVDNQTVAARRDPYYIMFDRKNDTVGYFRDQDPNRSMINSYEVSWVGDRLTVYAQPIIDKALAETIVPAQQGVVEKVSEDTLQIRWDHGIVNKFRRTNHFKDDL